MNAVTPVVTSNQAKHVLKEHTRRELDQCGHLLNVGTDRFSLDVICNGCAQRRMALGQDAGTPIYHHNIGGYSQRCADCGAVVHEGDKPNLFNGR